MLLQSNHFFYLGLIYIQFLITLRKLIQILQVQIDSIRSENQNIFTGMKVGIDETRHHEHIIETTICFRQCIARAFLYGLKIAISSR